MLDAMTAWLKDLRTGERWALTGRLDNVIGRDPHARVRLALGTVGRRHSKVRRSELGWEVADLGSSGGTWLRRGGSRASRIKTHPLQSGDVLVYGGAELQFDDDGIEDDDWDSPNSMTQELIQLLESGADDDRRRFLTAELIQLPAECGPLLEKRLTAPEFQSEQGRRCAAQVIGELCVNSVPETVADDARSKLLAALLRLANDRAPEVRVQAVLSFGRLTGCTPVLHQALSDPDVQVFEAALHGLRRQNGRALEPLEQLLANVTGDRHQRVVTELEVERGMASAQPQPEPEPEPERETRQTAQAAEHPAPALPAREQAVATHEEQQQAVFPRWFSALPWPLKALIYVALSPVFLCWLLLARLTRPLVMPLTARWLARQRSVGWLNPSQPLSAEERLEHLPRALLAFRDGEDLEYGGHILKRARFYRAATLAQVQHVTQEEGSVAGFDAQWTEVRAQRFAYGWFDHSRKLHLFVPPSRKCLTRVFLESEGQCFVVAAEERTGRHLIFIKAAAGAVRSVNRPGFSGDWFI